MKKAFLVVVTGKLAPGHLEKFKEALKPLAAHVAENEEGCLAYELSVNADDPDSFIIYERYISREYVEQVHFLSGPFQTLKQTLGTLEWVEPIVIKMYQEADVGF